MDTWISDDNGNRCSVEHWGSEEEARRALESLKDCSDCSNCSDCLDCSRCSYCSHCSRCSRCWDCSYCSHCSRCSVCSRCSLCSRCSGKKGQEETAPSFVPVIPDIHKRIYELASQPEALAMDSWHTCEKTHCRAGWVVTAAGDVGRELESYYDTALAAMLIYDASDPGFKINPCRFFDDNDDALADMRRLAEMHG